MAKHGFVRKLTSDAGHAAAGRTEEAVARAADKARQAARDTVNGGRFTCSCGEKSCPGSFRTLRAQKAHAAKHHMAQAGRWTSKSARAAERRMGKALSDGRRHAISWLEAAGLKEWRKVPIRDKDGKPRTRADGKPMTREVPVDTAKARARPELAGRVKIRDLREADHHDRHAERTDRTAGKHERRADRADARGKPEKAAEHRQRVIDTRQDHHQRWPEREPARTRSRTP